VASVPSHVEAVSTRRSRPFTSYTSRRPQVTNRTVSPVKDWERRGAGFQVGVRAQSHQRAPPDRVPVPRRQRDGGQLLSGSRTTHWCPVLEYGSVSRSAALRAWQVRLVAAATAVNRPSGAGDTQRRAQRTMVPSCLRPRREFLPQPPRRSQYWLRHVENAVHCSLPSDDRAGRIDRQRCSPLR